eukprot:m.895332 g.895332  ORF g.895332 m.895332 type:complete len:67 (+) comp59994_c0_seq8:4102-4302(+)
MKRSAVASSTSTALTTDTYPTIAHCQNRSPRDPQHTRRATPVRRISVFVREFVGLSLTALAWWQLI